jgi:hypothetical protein
MSLKEFNRRWSVSNPDKKHLINFKWWSECLEKTDAVTSDQLLWVLKHTLICAILCFGVDFAIGYMIYAGGAKKVLFGFPDSLMNNIMLCTNLVLTLIWYFDGTMMCHDILAGKIAPLSSAHLAWWPAKTSKLYWWFGITDLVVKPNTLPHVSLCKRIYWAHIRSTPRIILATIILVPPIIGTSYGIWGNKDYTAPFLPELILAVYGSLLAVVTVPAWALMTLADIGDRIDDEKKLVIEINASEINISEIDMA